MLIFLAQSVITDPLGAHAAGLHLGFGEGEREVALDGPILSALSSGVVRDRSGEKFSAGDLLDKTVSRKMGMSEGERSGKKYMCVHVYKIY